MDTDQDLASKTRSVLLWVVTAVGALGMATAGLTKFTAPDMWNELFVGWGYSIGFKTLIGILEIVGAAAVLIPRFAAYAATLLVAIMLGAVYTVYVSRSDLGVVVPLGNLVIFTIVAVVRWPDRWTPAP